MSDTLGGPKEPGQPSGIYAIALLKPGVTLHSARRKCVILPRGRQEYPKSNTGIAPPAIHFLTRDRGDERPALLV